MVCGRRNNAKVAWDCAERPLFRSKNFDILKYFIRNTCEGKQRMLFYEVFRQRIGIKLTNFTNQNILTSAPFLSLVTDVAFFYRKLYEFSRPFTEVAHSVHFSYLMKGRKTQKMKIINEPIYFTSLTIEEYLPFCYKSQMIRQTEFQKHFILDIRHKDSI